MRRINYKSDFDFVLKLKECKGENQEAAEVPFPDCDWEAVFYTSTKANSYTASCKGGEYVNCFKDEGGIHLVFNDHRMGVGTLKWEPHFELPNDIYPDSIQDLFSKQQLGIELVNGPGDCPTTAEVAVLLPYIKGEPFTFEDFTPEQIEDLQKPAAEAAERLDGFVKTASESEAARELNEQSRVSAESERVSQEELRQTAETARQSNETAREAAEAKRAEAEDARRTAETERAAEFATWETELDGKQDKLSTTTDLHITDDNIIGLTELAKMRLFIDMWNSACGIYGKYNAATGYFELNGLVDITYKEAVLIYANRRHLSLDNHGFYSSSTARTNLLPSTQHGLFGYTRSLEYSFNSCTNMEVIRLAPATLTVYSSMLRTFNRCVKLRKILGAINVLQKPNLTEAFALCPLLEEVQIKGLTQNLSFSDSPLLSLDSLSYLVAQSAASKPITVTVHPEVYAKLADETNTEWHPLMAQATAKQITFATTE